MSLYRCRQMQVGVRANRVGGIFVRNTLINNSKGIVTQAKQTVLRGVWIKDFAVAVW